MSVYRGLIVTVIAMFMVLGFSGLVYAEDDVEDGEDIKQLKKPESLSEYKDFLLGHYNELWGFIDEQGSRHLRTDFRKNGKAYSIPINTSNLLNKQYLFYGVSTDANSVFNMSASENTWYPTLNTNRYIGVTLRGYHPFPNKSVVEDYATSGATGSRRYVDWRKGVVNRQQPNTDTPWNDVSTIRRAFADGNLFITPEEAGRYYDTWIDNLYDHYKDNHDRYRVESSGWIERDTTNHFKSKPHMTMEYKKMFTYIVQPPTEFTWGAMSEWHQFWNGNRYTNNRHLYDVFNISPTVGVNFVAEDLKLKFFGDSLNVQFKVKNDSGQDLAYEKPALSSIEIRVNGVLKSSLSASGLDLFPTGWVKDESIIVDVGDVVIDGLKSTDEVSVTAIFNDDAEQGWIEKDYSDNKITKKIKKPKAEACGIGGRGSSMTYSVLVCPEESPCYCSSRTATLKHDMKLSFIEDRQALMGLWSSNTNGHLKYKNRVSDAKLSNPVEEEWENKIINGRVPGVSKLKRVIRSGRSIQMYGTLRGSNYLEAFEDSDILDEAQKNYIETLIKNLTLQGVDVGNGAVVNHKKARNGKDTAQLDKERVDAEAGDEDGLYVKFKKGDLGSTRYGSSSCTRITVYDKSYDFEFAVKTNNSAGEQETAQGDFPVSSVYGNNKESASFFTNIDTMNGLHAVKFRTIMEGSSVDNGFNRKFTCESTEEGFAVQGNIYDDVRTEDVTDKVGEDNWEW